MDRKLYPSNSGKDEKVLKIFGAFALAVMIFVGGIVTGRSVSELDNFDLMNIFSSNDKVTVVGDTSGKDSGATIDFDLYWTLWNSMRNRYVDGDQVDEKEMFYESIKGMVASTGDPHTIFLDPEETEMFNNSIAGHAFSGIGAELGYIDGRVAIIAPLKGSPAMSAGILAGDIIVAIDGEPLTKDNTIYDAVSIIRGEKGTDVVLTVVHKGDIETTDITITRDDITIPSMAFTYDSESDIAVVEVSRFTESTVREWQDKWDEAIDQVISSGAQGLVLDLRGNPGGYIDAAVYAAGEFMEEGTIAMQQEDRNGHVLDHTILREGRLLNMPVVVLVNEASASASEILAGGLQKNNRATVMGVDTFGKGTAQEVIDYADGSSAHITVLKWLLPDGTWINEENKVVPDKKVEITEDDFLAGDDPQLDAAIAELQ